MISKEMLKKYANNLMFDMSENEYETLQEEFQIITKQLELINDIPNIKNVDPMTFPFILEEVELRDDIASSGIDNEDAFTNCHGKKGRDVKVPRVVE